jgi:hypothetical protein
VYEPRAAIAQLARTIISAGGVASSALDYTLLGAMPSLSPYAELSPLLSVTARYVHGVTSRLTGRNELAQVAYREHIERLSQPDRGGLGASYHRHTSYGIMCALGLLDATLGLDSSLSWANTVEGDALYQVNAWQIRMIHHLWQGRVDDADACQKRVEVLRIQNSPRQWLEGVHLFGELTAYAAIGDLTRMKQALPTVEALTQRYVGWVPVLHYARGEYQRLRGDLAAARTEFERGLALTAAGGHQMWAPLAGGLLKTLFELGKHAEAIEIGRGYLAQGEAAELGYLMNHVRMPLSLCEAATGDADAALAHADAAIDSLMRFGSRGVNLGMAYETRARVASYLRDAWSFEHHAGLCAEQYRESQNRALVARYDKLVAEARSVQIGVSAEVAEAAEFTDTGTSSAVPSQITSMMEGYNGPKERARRSLELLLKVTGCDAGFLYVLQRGAPVLTAQISDHEPPDDIDARVKQHLETEMQPSVHHTMMTQTHTATFEGDPEAEIARFSAWLSQSGRSYRPVMLSHATPEGYAIVGLAVLAADPTKAFQYPARLAADLSRFACDSGDVSAFMTQEAPRSLM